MYAQAGVMRAGASRANYTSMRPFVSIGGTHYAVGRSTTSAKVLDGLTIRQAINDTPDTCSFTVRGFVPNYGAEVIVTLGSKNNPDRLFAGVVLTIEYSSDEGARAGNYIYDVSCVDFTWHLGRKNVTKRYTSESATDIAIDLMADAPTGFSTQGVETDLETLDEFTVTNTPILEALRRLAKRIGAYCDVSPHKKLWFGVTSRVNSGPGKLLEIDDDNRPAKFNDFRFRSDISELVTRVVVEGGGVNTLTAVDAGETILPVDNTAWYNESGGAVRCGPQRITYTGISEGGDGTLVGPGVSPAAGPTATPQAGAGIESGVHGYAVTFVTGAGESLPSPTTSATTGVLADPSPTLTYLETFGNGPDPGFHGYAVSFVAGAGETLAGISAGTVTTRDVSPPVTPPTATLTESNGCIIDAPGDSYDFAYLYVTATLGTTTLSTSAGAQTATACSSNGSHRKDYQVSVFASTDPAVVYIWTYVNKNGGGWKFMRASGNLSHSFFVGLVSYTGIAAPVANTAYLRTVGVYGIPKGPTGTTARKLYRTVANASVTYANLKLLATIADNTTTSYQDAIADASLGAAAPGSNTTNVSQVALSGIAIGGTGTTSRKVYRTAAGESQLKLLTTIADNTTTTHTDSAADGTLGANVPTSDTSGLTTTAGQVVPGSTSVVVAGTGPFSASGGWASIGNGRQTIRYTGITGSSLTGVPATGAGAITAAITYGSTITSAPSLTGIPASGVGAIVDEIRGGEPVNLLAEVDDLAAQDFMAALLGDDGIIEEIITDGRLSEDEAQKRARATLESKGVVLQTATWKSRDINTRAGRIIPIQIDVPGLGFGGEAIELRIQSVTIDNFHPALAPTFSGDASSQRYSFEDLLRQLQRSTVANG